MSDIKVIIFDSGGVVFENGTRKLKEFLQSKYSIEEAVLNDLFYGKQATLLRTGKISAIDFWNFVASFEFKKGLLINKDEIRDYWYNFFTPREGIFTLLKRFYKHYELGLVSGNIQERVIFLDNKYDFRKYFDWEIYSFDIGVNKPNIKIYKEIFKMTKANASNCLYIDDKDIFLEPAQCLGMQTILFENEQKFLKDLNKLGIII